MRRIILTVALAFLAPFLASANNPAFSNPVPVRGDALDSAKNLSSQVESYVTPQSAKDKGFWPWIREESKNAAGYLGGFVKSVNYFAGDRLNSLAGNSLVKSAEGLLRSLLQIGEDFIKEIVNFIKEKL